MPTLNERIEQLEQTIKELRAKILDLSANTEEKNKQPYTILGGQTNKAFINPYDLTSKQGMYGGTIFWNDSEIGSPNQVQPSTPTKGYHKHTHSRYSGGALVKDVLEIVEYAWGGITNKHSQQFAEEPEIAVTLNSKNETVQKIGKLDLVFNPDTLTWGVNALEIDITKCYFVKRDTEGNIEVDSKGHEKKSFLYNDNKLQTSFVWDENGNNGNGCWRLLAVYASGDE